jgi:sugar O-acyltransferase (sialic acid O-acetyltransferase NeuD family)
MDDVSWGEGCLFSPRCTLTSNIRIGSHFHCNIASYVEHDCRIGDFVTFGPGVRCNGNVTIGDGAYIGSGAMIRQGITIGESATVGMGAVVVRDVAPNTVVAGNPARPLAGRLARASELPPRARR